MPAILELNKGTKEFIVIDVEDRLKNLTTLVGTTPTYDVYADNDANTHVVTAATPALSGLEAHCLIDTTLSGFTPGKYKLYLSFSATPELPMLGPVKFEVTEL